MSEDISDASDTIKVRKFNEFFNFSGMVEESDGRYVLLSDYEEIHRELIKVKNILKTISSKPKLEEESLVYRLRKRAEIRRQIPTRKSVQEGKPDRLSDLLEEAAEEIEKLNQANLNTTTLLTSIYKDVDVECISETDTVKMSIIRDIFIRNGCSPENLD